MMIKDEYQGDNNFEEMDYSVFMVPNPLRERYYLI